MTKRRIAFTAIRALFLSSLAFFSADEHDDSAPVYMLQAYTAAL